MIKKSCLYQQIPRFVVLHLAHLAYYFSTSVILLLFFRIALNGQSDTAYTSSPVPPNNRSSGK